MAMSSFTNSTSSFRHTFFNCLQRSEKFFVIRRFIIASVQFLSGLFLFHHDVLIKLRGNPPAKKRLALNKSIPSSGVTVASGPPSTNGFKRRLPSNRIVLAIPINMFRSSFMTIS
ncbi:hypothetical protein I7I53_06993 [Histoplasma capsulatum var. duboisii H88]|uniref:Uncharacterized protein n=1 Tax=Ajellomyces capsulatus (strain H88) TaxID=544711 RepID=A0A8A1LCH2_AJEC8|nr:hypothetical protein I7I53_06993 [Histoplasma capsulatum var. duboisii H88]